MGYLPTRPGLAFRNIGLVFGIIIVIPLKKKLDFKIGIYEYRPILIFVSYKILKNLALEQIFFSLI